jgi:hypothetical protein
MASADAVFQQADTNQDNRLDLGEFRNLVSSGAGGAGIGGGYGASSSYESSSYGASGAGGFGAGGAGGYGAGGAVGYGAGFDSSAGFDASAAGGYGGSSSSSYEASSYESSAGGVGLAGGLAGGVVGGASYDASGAGVAGYSGESSFSQQTAVSQYATDSKGLFQDSNPQIIRKPAPGGVVTYKQNIMVRFLQPPAIPPPGPLIIKEVRPPQPPAPPPLVVRQRAPPVPQPPPLILRERPPPVPASVASQTIIRKLAALPVPPRSVITEKLPALPPKPRDIIIERWVPYGAMQKRRTIVQRAAAAVQYKAPRNIIIQYEAPQVRIVRQFQRLGVQPENPQAYIARYGASLRDSVTLVQEARQAGVLEDISPPVVPGSFAATEGQFSSTGGAIGAGGITGGGAGGILGEVNLEANAGGVGTSSSFESSSYSSSAGHEGVQAIISPSGVESHLAGSGHLGASQGYSSGSFGASDLAPGLDASSLGGGAYGSSSYQSSSYSSAGVGAGDAAFQAADQNHDGVLSQGEFKQFTGL